MQFFPISEAETVVEIDAKGKEKKQKKKGYTKILMDGKKYIPETGKIKQEP